MPDHLSVSRDQVLGAGEGLTFLTRALGRSQIVDPGEDDEPVHLWHRQHVAVEARQHVRTEPVAQDAVAARGLVQHGDVRRGRVGLQST